MDAATLGAAIAIAKSIPNTAVGDATAAANRAEAAAQSRGGFRGADRSVSGAGPHAPGRKNLRES